MATEITTTSSSQANIDASTSILRENIYTIASSIVWKNLTEATENENSDNAYLAEIFVMAHRDLLSFSIIKAFPRSVMRNVGIAETYIESYAADKTLIPESIRDDLVTEYKNGLTSTNPSTGHYSYWDNSTSSWVTLYEEKNNYYRKLMGLPDYGVTSQYVYNTDSRWSTTTPVHQMNLVDLIEMEQAGVLDDLIEYYSSFEYLKYVGSSRIDYYKSRTASRFDLLSFTDSSSSALNEAFTDEYARCNYMVSSVYYSRILAQSNDLYENFLAMSILLMTIQGVFSSYLNTDITRDFFDVESLKLIYDSYQVPFYSEIPLDYHVKIVKNINKLLSYKGSSIVFFDLFEIFDLASMNIYSYYITKKHIIGDNGVPLFITKKDDDGNDMYDDDGDPIMDDSVFEINFSKVEIYDDPALAVSDPSNDVAYEAITTPDPYWIEDEDLQAKLSSEYWNFTESKYLGIQTIFDLMKITFENAYVFRMVTDNKTLTQQMPVKWVETGIDCTIYSIFIYLASIYCRYYGHEGYIDESIPAVMETLGYNFEDSLNILRDDILNDPILSTDSELIAYITAITVSNADSLNTALNNINSIRDYIIDKFTNASTITEFHTYKGLYHSLLVSYELTEVYTDPSTGEVYHQFTDILLDNSAELMQRYLILDDTEIADEMTLIINQLEKMITSLRYLPYSAGVSSSAMIESLFKILTFFKSAKAELVDYQITYMVTMRGMNFFKMMDLVKSIHTESYIDGYSAMQDLLHASHILTQMVSDYNTVAEKTGTVHYNVKLSDIQVYTDIILYVSEYIHTIYSSESWYIDILEGLTQVTNIKSYLKLSDSDRPGVLDFMWHEDRYTGTYKDIITTFTDALKDGETGEVNILSRLLLTDALLYSDTVVDDRSIKSIQSLVDYLEVLTQSEDISDEFIFSDIYWLIVTNHYSLKDNGEYQDILKKFYEDFTLFDSSNNVLLDFYTKYHIEINISSRQYIEDLLHTITSLTNLSSDQLLKDLVMNIFANTIIDDVTVLMDLHQSETHTYSRSSYLLSYLALTDKGFTDRDFLVMAEHVYELLDGSNGLYTDTLEYIPGSSHISDDLLIEDILHLAILRLGLIDRSVVSILDSIRSIDIATTVVDTAIDTDTLIQKGVSFSEIDRMYLDSMAITISNILGSKDVMSVSDIVKLILSKTSGESTSTSDDKLVELLENYIGVTDYSDYVSKIVSATTTSSGDSNSSYSDDILTVNNTQAVQDHTSTNIDILVEIVDGERVFIG